jgi:hypothetical protein
MTIAVAIHKEEMGLLSGATLALRAVSTGLSADDPMSKTGRSVRRVLHSFVLLAAIAAPAAGQVIPTRPPVPSVPGGPLQRELPRLPTDDLIIQSVNVKDVVAPAPATIALVTIKNQGSADIVFPAGSVLARGDAARPGGINFPALTTPTEFMIAAGASKQLTLSVGDVCAAGHPGSVTFRVDPANVIREMDEGNNAMSVQVSSFASGDLRPVIMVMENGPSVGESEKRSIQSSYPATEIILYQNVGSGPILHCPGVTLWRETASPVSSKYGLRDVKNTSGKAIIVLPGMGGIESKIPGALQPGDLPPGTFTWSILMNPDGKIRETIPSNNAITTQIIVK